MKKIQNKKRFITAFFATILASICIIVSLLDKQNLRFIITAILLFVFAVINYKYAFNKGELITDIIKLTDERDQFIAMKSCQTMVNIVSHILLTVCLVSLILYGTFKISTFLIVAVTLCSVLIIMFFTILLTNSYYESHE